MKSIDRSEIEAYTSLELLAKDVVQGFITGLHKSPFHGFSVEFAEHRQYNSGESTRHLDWKLYGRTERLYVKQFEEETNLRASFLLDASPSMYYPKDKERLNKLEYGAYATAVLLQLLIKQRDAFSLTAFDTGLISDSIIKSTPAHLEQIYGTLNELLALEPKQTGGTNLAEVLHLKADTLPPRSMVVLMSDFLTTQNNMEDVWEGFRHLTHKQHDVIVFHLSDKGTEVNLELGKKQVKFVDAESGEQLTLNPEQYSQQYQSAMQQSFMEIKNELHSLRVDLCEVDVKDPFDTVMRAYLARRKKFLQSKRF